MFSGYSEGEKGRRGVAQEGNISVAVLWWHCAGDYASCDVVRVVCGSDRVRAGNP